MLPDAHRMRRSRDFETSVRRGRRASARRLVVHAVPDRAGRSPSPALPSDGAPTRVGFVVGRSVGGSVTRHRVARRLRHLVAARLDGLPSGQLVVVRALPAAADAPSSQLSDDLDLTFTRLFGERP